MAIDAASGTPPDSVRGTRHTPVLASVVAVTAGVVWSFGAINAKLARHADAWQYLVWRSVGVVATMELLDRWRHRYVRPGTRSITARAYRSGPVMVVATAALMLASVCYIYALKTTIAANVSLLASVTPLLAAVLARVFIAERVTPVTVVAMVVAFAGLVIMVTGGGTGSGTGSLAGNLSAMASALGFAGYAVCVRSGPRGDWSPVLAGYGAMTIVLCGAITVAGGRPLVPPVHDVALALVHGAVFIVGGTMLFNTATRSVGAGPMAVFAQSETVFVPVWAFVFVHERPAASTLLGGAIILAAVVGKALFDAAAHARSLATPVPM